ncbi:MAG: hypothetical protein ABIJ09_04230 [Pseudomonadota bacterium]
MADKLTQLFPRRVDGQITHRTWSVDLGTALHVNDLGDGGGSRLHREVQEMAEHLPRWVLTVAENSQRIPCPSCGGVLVFDRGIRCAECERALASRQIKRGFLLAWFGLMPPIGIDGLGRLKAAVIKRAPPQHVVGQQAGIGHFLLVPLTAIYPPGFPHRQVKVAYLPGFFSMPGVPSTGMRHDIHMLDQGFMCLFAGGQWQPEMSCREVLQQRAYAHVVKLLNFGNGKKNAFAKVS